MFIKKNQAESTAGTRLICEAMNWIGENYFCSALDPAVCFVDHSAGLKAGCQETWNDMEANTCWPHISRKASEGEFLSKTHPIFDSLVGTLLPTVHLTHTASMMDLFVDLLGQVIHPYMTEEKLRTFWNRREEHKHRMYITLTSRSHHTHIALTSGALCDVSDAHAM